MVSKTEATSRNARPVATVVSKTISDFTTLRAEMRSSAARERVPAGGVTVRHQIHRTAVE